MTPAPASGRARQLLLARWVSILGHPLLLMPAAGALAWFAGSGRTPHQLLATFAGWLLLATAVLGYSWGRVGSGAWTHVDASGRDERRDLNRVLLGTLSATVATGVLLQWPHPILLGLLLCAAIVLAAMLCGRWCKASLHMAFAVFAAAVLQPVLPWALPAGGLLAIAIGWSRLRLQRHVAADLYCGAALGLMAGWGLRVGLAQLAS